MNYARHREWELGLERRAEHEATLEAARVRVFELVTMLLDESNAVGSPALGTCARAREAIAAYEALAKDKP